MKESWIQITDLNTPIIKDEDKPFLTEARVAGRRLCLLKNQGKWYAMNAKCPHANGPMAAGFINEEGKIVCPWHRFAFELKTGQSDSGGYCLKMYDIKEKKDGSLWVKFNKKPWYQFW